MKDEAQIAAIAKVIADLPPGLTPEGIAKRVWAVVEQPAPEPGPDPAPQPEPPPVSPISDAEHDFLLICHDEGSFTVTQASPDSPLALGLENKGYVMAAARGADYAIYRLTLAGRILVT